MSGELKILTPVGMLGYGFNLDHFWDGVGAGADAIVIDSGSTDNGPQELALGKRTCSRSAYLRDLEPMLEAVATRKIPLLVGSAGGTGTNAQVDFMIDLVREIAAAKGHRFKAAAIYADVPKALVRRRFAEGRIAPCGPVPPLTEADIDDAVNIVAQMGVEPFSKALDEAPDLDVIIAGRAYDPAPYAALCLRRGFDPGVAWHMGKIMECGGVCAEPKGGVILATIRADSFDLVPMTPGFPLHPPVRRRPYPLREDPGGPAGWSRRRARPERRDLRAPGRAHRAGPRQRVPARALRGQARGRQDRGAPQPSFIGGVRDPILIGQIDFYLEQVRNYALGHHPALRSGEAQLIFHVYGKNGVMGELEPLKDVTPHEVCILGEAIAPTQELASAICSTARIAALHAPYPGQLATGGNMAFPLTPLENEIGPVCAFNLYHLMEVDSPTDMFPIRYLEI